LAQRFARRLAADGASVAITYAKDASAASAVVKAIELDAGKAIAIQADAANVEAVKGAVEKAVSTFGRLDVLVNNAGTAIPKPFEEATQEEMDRVVDINVRGVFATTQAALKHMKGGGRIIMVGSAMGESAVAPGLVPYAATEGCRQDVHPAVRFRTTRPIEVNRAYSQEGISKGLISKAGNLNPSHRKVCLTSRLFLYRRRYLSRSCPGLKRLECRTKGRTIFRQHVFHLGWHFRIYLAVNHAIFFQVT